MNRYSTAILLTERHSCASSPTLRTITGGSCTHKSQRRTSRVQCWNRIINQQDHQPVVIPSGSFNGSQKRWILTEKEALPIFEATEHIRHFVLSTQNLKLLTHHRILAYVFNPSANANDLNKNAAEKLCRWPMKLYASRFTIQDLPGEANTWADILSRWDIPPRQID